MTFQVSPAWIGGIHRIDVARHNGLQRRHDVRAHDHRVDAVVRHCTVGADALDDDLEDVVGGHHRTGAHGELANRNPRDVVHAVDALDRELLEQPLFHHDASAAFVLLGRLEDEIDRAVKVLCLGQVLGRTQQHHRVTVVAAGVHLARDRRLVIELVGLVDVERVHVGAEPNRPLRSAGPQHAHHAGLGEASVNFQTERLQLVRNNIGGPHFLEGCLGMTMDVVAPSGHVLVKRRYAVDDRHPCSPTNKVADRTAPS
jgi:hypothetical protein